MRAELLLPDHLCSFDKVSDLEDPLDRRLLATGVGEVVGGGIGSGWYRFDLELESFEKAAEFLKVWSRDLDLPEGSCLRDRKTQAVTILVPDSAAN